MKRIHWKIVEEYTNAVVSFGPDSQEVQDIRMKHKDVDGFDRFADALDEIKRSIIQKEKESTNQT